MSGFDLQRLGQIMEPEPGNPMEVEGVLNPAAVRGTADDADLRRVYTRFYVAAFMPPRRR